MKILNERSGPKEYASTQKSFGINGVTIHGSNKGTNPAGVDNYKYMRKNPEAKRFTQMKKQKISNGRFGTVRSKTTPVMEEAFKKLELLDFTRRSYEAYYNNYYEDNSGTLKANRIRVRGYRFFDNFNNQVARVEVESKNEKNIITIFEVNPVYKGLGFGKDLLRMAEISLTANAAEIDISEESKIRFFERNGFIKIGMKKQTCILELDSREKVVDRAKSVEYFDQPSIKTAIDRELNNELYHTGGYDYEGYRNYL